MKKNVKFRFYLLMLTFFFFFRLNSIFLNYDLICSHINLFFSFFSKSKYHPLLRSAFCKLTICCWLDGENYPLVNLPNYIRNWNEISIKKHLNPVIQFNPINKDMLKNLKNYIEIYLGSLV